MKEQLISLETAKLAKEKSFNIIVHNYYHPNYGISGDMEDDFNSVRWAKKYYSAPTQSLLQKWLREKHNIHIFIHYNTLTERYRIEYITHINKEVENNYPEFKTYEGALEKGLFESLKLIK